MYQLYSPTFTKWVGVSPSTTTIQQLSGLGVCEPGHYGPAVMLPGSAPPPMPISGTSYMPYASEVELKRGIRGLRGGGMRWDLLALTVGVGFAGVLGYALYKRKR